MAIANFGEAVMFLSVLTYLSLMAKGLSSAKLFGMVFLIYGIQSLVEDVFLDFE